MNTRHERAMTLVELVLALTPLSALGAALGAWCQATLRGTVEASRPARWEAAARAVLRSIEQDLLAGDFAPDVERVRVEDDHRLVIDTRDRGPVARAYVFDRDARRLMRRGDVDAPLVPGVAEWTCVIDDARATLTVAIHGDCGRTVARTWRLR
jgi:hypothetical protein